MGIFALFLLVIIYFIFASSRVVDVLREFSASRMRGGMLIAMLAIPYILATLPAAETPPGDFLKGAVGILIYLFVPGLILLFRPERRQALDVFDLAAVLALWFPIEFGWLPKANVTLAPGVNLPLHLLTGVCLGFLLFLAIRPLPSPGYTFKLTWADLSRALLGLAIFILAGLPLGMAMNFIHFGLAPFQASAWLLRLAAVYLFTAVPEEFLFRGCIQNLIEQRFGRTGGTLLAAAVIFGLSHLNNTTAHYIPPNWRYVIIATLAGLAYGWVWRQSGKITASAITHALVNFVWGVVFAA